MMHSVCEGNNFADSESHAFVLNFSFTSTQLFEEKGWKKDNEKKEKRGKTEPELAIKEKDILVEAKHTADEC